MLVAILGKQNCVTVFKKMQRRLLLTITYLLQFHKINFVGTEKKLLNFTTRKVISSILDHLFFSFWKTEFLTKSVNKLKYIIFNEKPHFSNIEI
jgi:hypothetical protein